jgi:predicted nucleic acid-binding Zn ribbon protein
MRPLTHAVPGALMQLLRDLPLSDGMVGFAWGAAVGPAVARATTVKLEHAVLIVETTSVEWTREIKRSTPVILKRLQSLLGDAAVTEIIVRS